MSRSKTYPDKKSVQVYQSEHVAKVEDALTQAKECLDDDEPPETEQIAHVAEAFLEQSRFRRLADDMRIQEARQAVAKDHGMVPEDVSIEALLKVTCSAYLGYQQTSDWLENGDSA